MDQEKHVLGPKARDFTKDPPYGRLTVIKFAHKNEKGMSFWLCRCECGNEKIVCGGKLISGVTSSCGCKRFEQRTDLTGQQIEKWKVLSFAGKDKNGNTLWLCQCSCGSPPKKVHTDNLVSKKSKSCGCFRSEANKIAHTTHGHTKGKKPTTEYRAWCKAIGRCFDKNDKGYDDYGGRGITMCKRWRENFEAFIADVGPKPAGKYSIDRRQNMGNYSCGSCEHCLSNGWDMNVRWATDLEQARNKRNNRLISFNGKTMCLAELARLPECVVSQHAISKRLAKGWSVERAITTPSQIAATQFRKTG